jgi:hypothetical protein
VQRDPLVYLDDILQACRSIQRYTADLTFEQFDAHGFPLLTGEAWPDFAMYSFTGTSTSTWISRGRSSANVSLRWP